MLQLGPFGSENGGEGFDHGAFSTVRQVVISHTSGCIRSIQFEYDDNGSSLWSEKYGSPSYDEDTYIDTIKLDYPDEYLISVYGNYVSLWWFPTYISTLTFKSNKKSYGPYGLGIEGSLGKYGNSFAIESPGNMIVGFTGRASRTTGIRAIGANLKSLDQYYPSKTRLRNKHDDDEGNRQIIVAGNQVIGNEGDQNGRFAVGNTYNKYKVSHYYYSEKFNNVM
ncbi:PREDICTED: jacalin-related lectin 3-like [Fragaria vesca subsp. vesca]|uniref:jacalin-related lectin 3-like n=1 Tax=Fragaria vesca subsp. vesca TaxID=101020 RepID=UPI0002C34602|nr:PREDICTED: jacalin-related lectin 3-like [Fragaria vesca subsp. vesca]